MVVRLLAGIIGSLILVDPDHLEPHNAPRVWFAGERSRGPKVAVAARALRRAFPTIKVVSCAEAFPSRKSTRLLEDADFLFVCPDHNAVRYAAARFAAERMTPLVEVGCGGRTDSNSLTALGYHARLQVPGGPCLACNGLDLSKLEDPSTTSSKRRAGYLDNSDNLAGELGCLTARAAADAVDLFLRYCTQYAGEPRMHIYGDTLNYKTLDLTNSYCPTVGCPICMPEDCEAPTRAMKPRGTAGDITTMAARER